MIKKLGKIFMCLFLHLIIIEDAGAFLFNKTYSTPREAYEDSQKNGVITVCGTYKQEIMSHNLGYLHLGGGLMNQIRLDGLSEAWSSYDGRYICLTGKVVDNYLYPGQGDYWMHHPSRDR